MKTDIKLKSHELKLNCRQPQIQSCGAIINRLSSRFLVISHISWETLNAGSQTRDWGVCSIFRASMDGSEGGKGMFVLAELLWACPQCSSSSSLPTHLVIGVIKTDFPDYFPSFSLGGIYLLEIFSPWAPQLPLGEFRGCYRAWHRGEYGTSKAVWRKNNCMSTELRRKKSSYRH